MSCQLKVIDGIRQENTWVNSLLQIRVKLLRPGKRKLIFFRNRVFSLFRPNKRKSASNHCKNWIGPGDLVRVCSKQEILGMLDDHEKYKGCLFIDEMCEHCDHTYKVLKSVEYFFDEAKQKMCRAKDTLILDGVICSGRQRLYFEKCDRSCFFFWHKDWLKKIIG